MGCFVVRFVFVFLVFLFVCLFLFVCMLLFFVFFVCVFFVFFLGGGVGGVLITNGFRH